MTASRCRRFVAEGIGAAFLVAAVVGSGIMGDRLANGNTALALLANTIATGAALLALILTFGPISGAHFNPVVTLSFAIQGEIGWRDTLGYICVQFLGAVSGAAAAHLMFGLPFISISHQARSGAAQIFSEFVATFGLLAVIWGCSRRQPKATPLAVAAYITAAYWFTASTSFANPAVTIGRSFSNTFSGIRPVDITGFIIAQLVGGLAATFLFRWLVPNVSLDAQEAIFEEPATAVRSAAAVR